MREKKQRKIFPFPPAPSATYKILRLYSVNSPWKNVSPAESSMKWNRLEIFNKFPCLMSSSPLCSIPLLNEFFFKKIVHKLGRFPCSASSCLVPCLPIFLSLSMHALPHLHAVFQPFPWKGKSGVCRWKSNVSRVEEIFFCIVMSEHFPRIS